MIARPTRVAVIGAGINGLVAASTLARDGVEVVVLERGERVGGACTFDTLRIGGREIRYAAGATVLGLMQDFVFRETGLAERLRIWAPDHPKLVYFPGDDSPVRIHRRARDLVRELGETGDLERFRADEDRVVDYLRRGYREARPPSLEEARSALGGTLVKRFIEGSAEELLDVYFESERTKLYMAMTVIESGPVSMRSPYSAFTIPLMDSGSVLGGYYGFVEGGIWRIPEELDRINRALGVEMRTGAAVARIETGASGAFVHVANEPSPLTCDAVVVATDPVSAAALVGEPELVSGQKLLGTSGKLTLFFDEPVSWKDDDGASDAEAAFRFLFFNETLDEMESEAQRVVDGGAEFTPGYIQIYCDGAGSRRLGGSEPLDRVVAFFKNVAFGPRAEELEHVRRFVTRAVLDRIRNPERLVASKHLAPRDMKDLFLFPEGNIEHTMLAAGQTFSDRHYAETPESGFYRLGGRANVFYCGSASYPCGSVAGTGGYMCARELLRSL